MRILVFATLLAILGSIDVELMAQRSATPEAEVLEAQALRAKAVMARDIAALESMVDDGLSYCHASAQVEDKTSYLNTVKTGRIRWITMMPEGMKAHVYGDTAVITGVLRQTILAGTQTTPVPLVIRSIEVYTRRNGRWQLVNFQATRVAE